MKKVHLPGSIRKPLNGAEIIRDAPRDKLINVSVYGATRLSTEKLPDPEQFSLKPPGKRKYLSCDHVNELLATDPKHLDLITEYLSKSGLKVSKQPNCKRSVSATGPVGKFQEAFGTKLCIWRHSSGNYRGRTGPLTVPAHLQHVIRGAFGLDNRRVGYSYLRRLHSPALGRSFAAPQTFRATDLARLYSFPSNTDGSGQTVAVLAFNGAIGETGESATGGFSEKILKDYFKSTLKLSFPGISTIVVQGPGNSPNPESGNDVSDEIMLDLTMVGATAPGAKIVVYFSEFTEQGWVNAINRIVQDHAPTIVSCSYGNPETSLSSDPQSIWSNAAIVNANQAFQMAALKGVTILAASGDNGSSDGERSTLAHADFPASSPWVTGCGGTRLKVSGTRLSESVWNDGPGSSGGGGISDLFPLPAYQANSSVPPSVNPGHVIGRGIPDVAGNGDPQTGVEVPQLQGAPEPIGGTSAVAPLWAGLIARVNQATGAKAGFMNPFLYKFCATGVLNDVTSGNNGRYNASKGWDACTGLGTPNGDKLVKAFKG